MMRASVLGLLAASAAIVAGQWSPARQSNQQDGRQQPLAADSWQRLQAKPDSQFQWSDITPNEQFEFHSCWDGYQCARLEVPMDRNSSSSEDKVAVAVIKLPAKVPVTDPRYGGPILINPGGPGGSGVRLFLGEAKQLQQVVDAAHVNDSSEYVVDDPHARYFDVIGFDPRGVNNTTPFYSCQKTTEDALRWLPWNIASALDDPDFSFETLWARHYAEGLGCIHDPVHNPHGSKIANFMTTANVVGDMVSIIERHGEWREKQASALGASGPQLDTLRWQQGEEPLNYWGYSYGTVLGATFSAMQPHRVHRVVLDGVVNSADFYSGDMLKLLFDTDESINHFFDYCAAAGPSRCDLYAGPRGQDTKARLDAIEDDLRRNGPIPVPATASRGPDIITFNDVRTLIKGFAYKPFVLGPTLARLVAPLSHRNGTLFAEYKATNLSTPVLIPGAPTEIDPHNPDSIVHNQFRDSGLLFQPIFCSDSAWNRTKAEFVQQWETMRNQSQYIGDDVARWVIRCASWRAQPKWRFADAHPIASNATANAILFASSAWDNVTPLRSARLMQTRFKGSGLVVVDGEGHCSVSSASLCLGRTAREYFQTGKVPSEERWCLPHERAFLGTKGPRLDPLPAHLGIADQTLLDALNKMRGFPESKDEHVGQNLLEKM